MRTVSGFSLILLITQWNWPNIILPIICLDLVLPLNFWSWLDPGSIVIYSYQLQQLPQLPLVRYLPPIDSICISVSFSEGQALFCNLLLHTHSTFSHTHKQSCWGKGRLFVPAAHSRNTTQNTILFSILFGQ